MYTEAVPGAERRPEPTGRTLRQRCRSLGEGAVEGAVRRRQTTSHRGALLPRSVRRAEPKFLPDRQTDRRPQATQAWNFLDSFRRRADGSPGAGSACQGCPVVRMYSHYEDSCLTPRTELATNEIFFFPEIDIGATVRTWARARHQQPHRGHPSSFPQAQKFSSQTLSAVHPRVCS